MCWAMYEIYVTYLLMKLHLPPGYKCTPGSEPLIYVIRTSDSASSSLFPHLVLALAIKFTFGDESFFVAHKIYDSIGVCPYISQGLVFPSLSQLIVWRHVNINENRLTV